AGRVGEVSDEASTTRQDRSGPRRPARTGAWYAVAPRAPHGRGGSWTRHTANAPGLPAPIGGGDAPVERHGDTGAPLPPRRGPRHPRGGDGIDPERRPRGPPERAAARRGREGRGRDAVRSRRPALRRAGARTPARDLRAPRRSDRVAAPRGDVRGPADRALPRDERGGARPTPADPRARDPARARDAPPIPARYRGRDHDDRVRQRARELDRRPDAPPHQRGRPDQGNRLRDLPPRRRRTARARRLAPRTHGRRPRPARPPRR